MANRSARRPCGSSPRRQEAATADLVRRPAPYLLAAALLSACGGPGAEPAWPAGGPVAGTVVQGDLAAGEEHVYPLDLAAGTYVRVVAAQREADLALVLSTPDGREIVADSPFQHRGAERLAAIAPVAGEHRLTLRNHESQPAGGYELRIEALRPSTPADRRVADAYLLHRELLRRRGEADGDDDAERRRAAYERLAAAQEELADEWRRLGEPAFEGRTLQRLIGTRERLRDLPGAAASAAAASVALDRAGEPHLAAEAAVTSAAGLLRADEVEGAFARYGAALERVRSVGDDALEASALRGLGRIHRTWGEWQQALDHYEQALELMPENAVERPFLLSDLGVLKARFLGDVEAGSELIAAARDGYPEPYRRFRAVALSQLAQLAFEDSRFEAARAGLEEALPLQTDPCERGITLARLALVAAAEGRHDETGSRLAEARDRVAEERCRADLATVELLAGQAAGLRGDWAAAEAAYRRCIEVNDDLGDRAGGVECRVGSASAHRRLGELDGALAAGEEALARLERARPTVLRTDLRMSFASELERPFDVVIATLLDLGRDEEAWVTAERARARALTDLLREAAAGVRREADPELLDRERGLRRRLNELESRRLGAAGSDEVRALADEVSKAVDELERLRGEMRRGRPLPAARHHTAAELRRQLDGDALLLEYRLGEEESVLWAVDRDRVVAHRLPSRGEIEQLAAPVAEGMRSRRYQGHGGCALARALLAPVAGLLGERPLVLVPDGVLETVSFAALPDPAEGCREPLVVRHAISYLPSAAALAEQRRRFAGRPAAERWLAMVADPIYQATGGERGGAGASGKRYGRLHFSAQEADDVAALLPAERVSVLRRAAATRRAVLDGGLGGARLVHVASHGEHVPEQPLLSSLVLSPPDAAGRPLAGRLTALEIYDLELQAELVVLSACDTARGRQVRGEGLVAGLPRAFLYAGAERVLVSLWQVDDARTRDLMVAFYRALLDDGLAPAEALRAAQRSVLATHPAPYWWAAFVLQGDPRPLQPFAD